MKALVEAVARSHIHPALRRRKATFALNRIKLWDVQSILVVGIHPDKGSYVNQIERELVDSVEQCVATGIVHPRAVPCSWRYVTADARTLPFTSRAFDLVYSNAVIEHVGTVDDQTRFVSEIDRVGKDWIITTPNLRFPFEAHTYTFMRHWTAAWQRRHRNYITRLLTRSTFQSLLPRGRVVNSPFGPTLTATSR